MTELAQQLNFLLALGTIAIQVAAVVLAVLLLLERYKQKTFRVLTLVGAFIGVRIVLVPKNFSLSASDSCRDGMAQKKQ